jgi:hypothetical protein
MSLLVQRVSGSRYGNLFFPQLAGVGYSFNPYVWTATSIPKPAWCGWCSAWAPAPSTARTTITRGSSP